MYKIGQKVYCLTEVLDGPYFITIEGIALGTIEAVISLEDWVEYRVRFRAGLVREIKEMNVMNLEECIESLKRWDKRK